MQPAESDLYLEELSREGGGGERVKHANRNQFCPGNMCIELQAKDLHVKTAEFLHPISLV